MYTKKTMIKKITIISLFISLVGMQCWGAANGAAEVSGVSRASGANSFYAALNGARAIWAIGSDREQCELLKNAVEANDSKELQKLIDAKADVNSGYRSYGIYGGNEDVLMTASKRNYIGIVGQLIAANADPNALNGSGYRPLIWAALHGFTEIVHLLIAAHADVNYALPMSVGPQYAGETALIVAAGNDHRETVARLIMAKANIHAVTQKGDTALALATKRKHSSVIAVINKALEAQLLGDKAAEKKLLSGKAAAKKLLSGKAAAKELLGGKAAAKELLGGKAAAKELLGGKAAAKELLGGKAAAKELLGGKAAAKELLGGKAAAKELLGGKAPVLGGKAPVQELSGSKAPVDQLSADKNSAAKESAIAGPAAGDSSQDGSSSSDVSCDESLQQEIILEDKNKIMFPIFVG